MTTEQLSHLNALQARLSNERGYLAAETTPAGKALRQHWIRQIEKEIADEYRFLGIAPAVECDMTDDELMAALA